MRKTVYISRQQAIGVWQRVANLAFKRRVSVSQVVTEALTEYLERHAAATEASCTSVGSKSAS